MQLQIDIEGRFAKFQDSLDQIGASTAKTASGMNRAFGAVTQVIGSLGIVASATSIALSFKTAIDAAENIGKLAEKVGATTQALSTLAFAADLSNVPVDVLQKGLKTLAVGMAETQQKTGVARDGFTALQLGVEKLGGGLKNPLDALFEIADRFKKMEDGAGKTAIAVKIFGGRIGEELIPLLNLGSDGIKKLQEEAKGLGIELDEGATKNASAFNDNLKRMAALSTAAKNALLEDLLPALNSIIEEFIRGRKEGGFFNGILQAIGKFIFDVSGGLSDPIQAAARDVTKLQDELLALNNLLNAPVNKSGNLGRALVVQSGLKENIDAKAAELKAAQASLENLQKLQSIADRAPPAAAKEKAPRLPGRPDAAALAEEKLFTSALQALEKELEHLNNQTKIELLNYELLHGSLQKLTPLHGALLIQKAREIDARKQNIERITAEYDSLKQFKAAQDDASVAVSEFSASQRDALRSQNFSSDLIGKSAFEIAKLTKAREIDAAAAIAAGKIDGELFPEKIADIYKMAKALKDEWGNALDAARSKERDWFIGAKTAFDEYIDAATNAGANIKNAIGNSLKSLEDALTEFFSTGKLNWKSFADSIIKEFARIEAKSLTAQIASTGKDLITGGGSIGNKLFGLTGGPNILDYIGNYAVGTDYVPRDMLAMVHKGEQIIPAGQGGGINLTVNMDNRGADPAVLQRLNAMPAQILREVMPRVVDSVRRGGSARSFVGR